MASRLVEDMLSNLKWMFSPDVMHSLEQPFEDPKKEKRLQNSTEFGSIGDNIKDVDLVTSDNVSNYFNTSFNIRDKLETVDDLLKLYRAISELSLVDDAIMEIVNEAILKDEDDIVVLDFNDKQKKIDEEVRKSILDEFATILDLLDFDDQGPDYFKQWYIDGRLLIQTVIEKENPEKGILKTILMSPLYLKRFYDEEEDEYYYVYDNKKMKDRSGNELAGKVPDELLVFVPSGKYMGDKKIPVSYLHTAVKDIQRLDILEDHMLIYRISRAPERRIFYIDPGTMPPKKAQEYLEKIIAQYKQKNVWDENSGVLSSKAKHPSMIEDFFLLRRGDKNTEIDTLQSGGALSDIDDLFYFKGNASRALKVPFSRLNLEDREGQSPTGNDMTREEIKFFNYYSMLQNKFSVLFSELLHKQLVYKNIIEEHEWESIRRKLKFKWKHNTQFIELKRLEVLETKLSILRDIDDYRESKYFSKEYIQKHVLGFNDEQIKEMDEQLESENATEDDKFD